MEPITATLGLISTGISLASGIGSLFSSSKANSYNSTASMFNAMAIQQKAEAEAKADEYNAQVAAKNAVYSQFEAETALAEQGRTAYRTQGAMKAAYGASGVSSDSGSVMDVFADSAASAARDYYNMKFSYDLQTQNFNDQKNLYNMAAGNSRAAAVLGLYANSVNSNAASMNNTSNMIKSIGGFASSASNMIPQYNTWYNSMKTKGYF